MMLHVCVCVVASIPFWETSAWRDFWQLLILVKTILVQFPPNGSIANSRRLSANLINWSKPVMSYHLLMHNFEFHENSAG